MWLFLACRFVSFHSIILKRQGWSALVGADWLAGFSFPPPCLPTTFARCPALGVIIFHFCASCIFRWLFNFFFIFFLLVCFHVDNFENNVLYSPFSRGKVVWGLDPPTPYPGVGVTEGVGSGLGLAGLLVWPHTRRKYLECERKKVFVISSAVRQKKLFLCVFNELKEK